MSATSPRRGRLVLVAVFALFFLPVAAAWLLNVLAPHWQPFGRVNEGTLVDPPIRLAGADLRTLAGEPLATDLLSGRWTLLHLQASDCDEPCRSRLAATRAARLALGDDAARVQRVLVQRPGAAPAELAEEDRDVRIAIAPASWPGPPVSAPSLLIVDPQGFLILRYPPDVTRRGLHADLKRLLKISQIG